MTRPSDPLPLDYEIPRPRRSWLRRHRGKVALVLLAVAVLPSSVRMLVYVPMAKRVKNSTAPTAPTPLTPTATPATATPATHP